MLKMDLQFFAHKKGVGSTKMVEIPNLKGLVLREQMVNS